MTLSPSEAKHIGKEKSIENHVWKPLQAFIFHSKSDWRMTTLETPDRIRSALACQVGTEHYWKVFPDDDAFKITDGVKMMAEMCEAFWLVADILACQHTQKAKREAFQTWTLTLNTKDKSADALLVGEDGNRRLLAQLEIPYTDFPLPEGITLFLEDGILLLPSEH